MKSQSNINAKQEIAKLFSKKRFSKEKIIKIKKLAMSHKIKLGKYRTLFCKSCNSQLKGKIGITKTHKTIECKYCNFKNKLKI